jgi:DNA ligase-1
MNFVSLYRSLDETNSKLDKVEALRHFFLQANPTEVALAMSLILGNLPPKRLKSRELVEAALAKTKIPEWLFDECYASVGDLAETVSLIVANKNAGALESDLSEWMAVHLKNPATTLAAILEAWELYDSFSLLVLMKIITGGLRIGVAKGLLIQAMAQAFDLPEPTVAHSLIGRAQFDAAYIEQLKSGQWKNEADLLVPYPFALASPIEKAAGAKKEDDVESLGDPQDWITEWKWDGIRGQWIYRHQQCALWSRGEELITERFPELQIQYLPFESLVLDGEVLAWQKGDAQPLPFQFLQTRIGRKKLTAASLKNAPVKFLAYDCLEKNGRDLRELPLTERRKILIETIAEMRALPTSTGAFEISTEIEIRDWAEARKIRGEARDRGVEGFILKRKTSPYFHGRKRGDWWKWKIDPMTLDAVLIYAQAGHGKRSNLFTDYTFALKDENDKLVTVAKAYSGLDDAEIRELDRWIRAHTEERFGPVRSVQPLQVFELGFEGIGDSGRHKSGLALRFPRILRWRKDKPVSEIDRVEEIRRRYVQTDASDNLSPATNGLEEIQPLLGEALR